jgi:hypothetical protein
MKRLLTCLFAGALIALPQLTRGDMAADNSAALASLQEQINELSKIVENLEAQVEAATRASPAGNAPLPDSSATLLESAPANWVYVRQLAAAENNGGNVRYSLVDAPEGMQILSLYGTIYWVPAARHVQAEPYHVIIRTSDGASAQTIRLALTIYAPAPGHYAVLPSETGTTPSSVLVLKPIVAEDLPPGKEEVPMSKTDSTEEPGIMQDKSASLAENGNFPLLGGTEEGGGGQPLAASVGSSMSATTFVIVVVALVLGYMLYSQLQRKRKSSRVEPEGNKETARARSS